MKKIELTDEELEEIIQALNGTLGGIQFTKKIKKSNIDKKELDKKEAQITNLINKLKENQND